jgi:hypothetical protein
MADERYGGADERANCMVAIQQLMLPAVITLISRQPTSLTLLISVDPSHLCDRILAFGAHPARQVTAVPLTE